MSDAEKLKVFISYSRKDSSDFADELVAGLELAGFAPFIDRHDIAAGEDWEARLGGLIEEADTVVFVISPAPMTSDRCAWEVDKTLVLSKRLMPVVFKSVPEADIPAKLRRLQFIRFDNRLGLARPLSELAVALRQDLQWIREHTRIAELAARWEARSRPESLLLRSDDLLAAKVWTQRRPMNAPDATAQQLNFVSASDTAETERRRQAQASGKRAWLLRTLLALLMVGIGAGAIAWLNERWIQERYFWFTTIQGHLLSARDEQALTPGSSFWECVKQEDRYSAYCPEMVTVPPGTFTMGSPKNEPGHSDEEGPQHEVTIAKPFAIAKYELTFDQWDICVQHGGCPHASAGITMWGRGKQPASSVSWNDAQEYVKWLSNLTGRQYRLPTEAEWEYSARAGTTTAYSFGDDPSALDSYAWYQDNSSRRPHHVGEKKPNAFGLHDMHGNVWEWVEDCFHSDYEGGAPVDGSAWTAESCTHRVMRGGAWSDRPSNLRSAVSGGLTPGSRTPISGFRVVRSLRQ